MVTAPGNGSPIRRSSAPPTLRDLAQLSDNSACDRPFAAERQAVRFPACIEGHVLPRPVHSRPDKDSDPPQLPHHPGASPGLLVRTFPNRPMQGRLTALLGRSSILSSLSVMVPCVGANCRRSTPFGQRPLAAPTATSSPMSLSVRRLATVTNSL
jgi:hypothetical protein